MQAVKHFMQGNDVFVSLPTGSGKSLIYAVLPFAYDELLIQVLSWYRVPTSRSLSCTDVTTPSATKCE